MCGGPLKCGGPCSAEHVRTLVNPALLKTLVGHTNVKIKIVRWFYKQARHCIKNTRKKITSFKSNFWRKKICILLKSMWWMMLRGGSFGLLMVMCAIAKLIARIAGNHTARQLLDFAFPSVLWHCWLGDRKGIPPVKIWVLVCWWWRFDWTVDPVGLCRPLGDSSRAVCGPEFVDNWIRS